MIQDIVKKTVEEANEKLVERTESKVRELVNNIISHEAKVVEYQAAIKRDKDNLLALQMPAEIKLEL